MVMTEADYVEQLWALLPPGPAWHRDLNPDLAQAFAGWASALFKADAQLVRLIEEADPRTTSDLLPDWERVAGLPDACAIAFGGDQTVGQRRAALLARLVSSGGMSIAYYTAVAQALGFAITVTEFRAPTVEDDVNLALVDDAWEAAWQINAPLATSGDMTVLDDVETPIAYWGNALLECVMQRLNRAGATLVFNYS